MPKSPALIKPKKISESCHHYWIIEPPDSKISLGQCKYCGIIKEFSNEYQGKFAGDLTRKRISDVGKLMSDNNDNRVL